MSRSYISCIFECIYEYSIANSGMTSISIMKSLIFEEYLNNSIIEFEIVFFKSE